MRLLSAGLRPLATAGTAGLLLLLLAAAPPAPVSALEAHRGPLLGLRKPREHYEGRFLEWMERFGVRVEQHEYLRRLRIWADNDDHIHAHNHHGNASYTLGHNPYSHLTLDEFHARFKLGRHAPRLYRRHPHPVAVPSRAVADGEAYDPAFAEQVAAVRLRGAAPGADDQLPAEVDWVAAGAVTPVKDQGMCGSCWAFSTVGAIEGAYFLKTGELLSFSEQELVDCDDNDFGCGGGLMDQAFTYLESADGLALEADYPYEATDGRCKLSKAVEAVEGTQVRDYTDVVPDSEQALKAAIAKQPISIAIEADERDFQLYASGVLTAECGTNLDHGVLAVGYGVSSDGIPFWKVKNSWSDSWGDQGYILLQRGPEITQEGGQCGILLAPSYPLL